MDERNRIPEDISIGAIWKSFGIFTVVGIALILAFYGENRFHYLQDIWMTGGFFFEVFLGAAAGIGFSALVVLLFYLNWITLPENEYTNLIKKLVQKRYGLFTVAFGAGVSEELLFRGAILGVAVLYLDNIPALLLVSFVFMALHIPQYKGSAVIHIVVFVMGAMLGLLFLWTGTLWAPILAHIVYNGTLSWMMKKRSSPHFS
ncbi:CPBP family intramembrane metalloprotease [Salibacterium salarium]|uniref:CPBP family intramembrane metalloprotease n=1 Tax=Salibacterium salarium TaxID=284579 RepID=A0A428N2P4_9BACI|nr:CPBP family intramembrane glutamic endopeptidase [Salibacterium salarium]RSL32721.1 CPBP family intramembrane metalloprotease [Salibacterium salarium]